MKKLITKILNDVIRHSSLRRCDNFYPFFVVNVDLAFVFPIPKTSYV